MRRRRQRAPELQQRRRPVQQQHRLAFDPDADRLSQALQCPPTINSSTGCNPIGSTALSSDTWFDAQTKTAKGGSPGPGPRLLRGAHEAGGGGERLQQRCLPLRGQLLRVLPQQHRCGVPHIRMLLR